MVYKDIYNNRDDVKSINKIWTICAEMIDNIGVFKVKEEIDTMYVNRMYLYNRIYENEWKKRIYKIFQSNLRNRIIRDCQLTLTHLIIERFRYLEHNPSKIEDIFYEFEQLRRLHNKTIIKELKLIGCRTKIHLITYEDFFVL